jgi:uncharacterized Zn-finger protein
MIDMKKVIAVILALVLALSVSAIAFAADGDDTNSSTIPTIDCPICGKRFLNTTGDLEAYNKHLEDYHKTKFEIGTDPETGETIYHSYFVCQTCGKKYENPDAYVACLNSHIRNDEFVCQICDARFKDYGKYNEHVQSHYSVVDHKWSQYIKLSLPELMDKFFGYMQTSGVMTTILDLFWDLYNRVMEYIVNGVAGSGEGEAEVDGAVDKLDAAIGGLKLPELQLTGIKDFMNAIKQKIKDFYANNQETVVEEVTNAEAPVETGSATAGIAVFAVISAAAAAAYVCSKKKA